MVLGKMGMGMGIGFFIMGMGGNGNRNSPSRTPLVWCHTVLGWLGGYFFLKRYVGKFDRFEVACSWSMAGMPCPVALAKAALRSRVITACLPSAFFTTAIPIGRTHTIQHAIVRNKLLQNETRQIN